jgi:hypothetical protein
MYFAHTTKPQMAFTTAIRHRPPPVQTSAFVPPEEQPPVAPLTMKELPVADLAPSRPCSPTERTPSRKPAVAPIVVSMQPPPSEFIEKLNAKLGRPAQPQEIANSWWEQKQEEHTAVLQRELDELRRQIKGASPAAMTSLADHAHVHDDGRYYLQNAKCISITF